MPVAPYDSDEYREWNRERMRRVRVDPTYRAREHGWRQVHRERTARAEILTLANERAET